MLAWGLFGGEARPVASGRVAPDVLLIVLDDVGVSDLVAVRDAGYLPNLSALAAGGFVFRNASSAPICSPTRRSIFFGDFHARQSGFGCGPPTGEEPPAGAVSIAALLAGRGYASAFLGKWHLGANPFGDWPSTVQDRGWDHWQAGVPYFVSGCGGTSYDFWTDVEDGVVSSALVYQPHVMRQRFQALWSSLPGPRFVTFSTQLAHAPYHRPPASLLPAGYPATPGNRAKYEAMIAALDVQVGQLLAHVDLATTVVIVVGDNGTPQDVSSDPTRAKTTTFQGGVHVPLFLRGAGIPRGSSQALVSTADLYATLAELAGAAAPAQLDSRSLLPLVSGARQAIHPKIAFGIRGDTPQFRDDVAARSLRYKLRRWRDDAAQPWVEEFYDLLVDPGERINLVGDPVHAGRVAAHRRFVETQLP